MQTNKIWWQCRRCTLQCEDEIQFVLQTCQFNFLWKKTVHGAMGYRPWPCIGEGEGNSIWDCIFGAMTCHDNIPSQASQKANDRWRLKGAPCWIAHRAPQLGRKHFLPQKSALGWAWSGGYPRIPDMLGIWGKRHGHHGAGLRFFFNPPVAPAHNYT